MTLIHTETDFLTILGARLEELRVHSGKSVDEMAEIAQISRRQWYRWVQGGSVPAYAVYRISRELNVSADSILP